MHGEAEVGEDPGAKAVVGVPGRSAMLLGRAELVARLAQVLRDGGSAVRSRRRAQERCGDPPMKQPPPRSTDLVVNDRAELLVGEVVGRLLKGEFADDSAS